MSKKNQIDELQYFIKNSFFRFRTAESFTNGKAFKKFKNNIKCDLPKVRIRILSNFNLEFIMNSIIFCFIKEEYLLIFLILIMELCLPNYLILKAKHIFQNQT